LEKQLALLSTNNQRIKSNTERLGRLMDAMLEMARLDKALTMKYATTNLNDLTQSAVHELQPLALTQQLTCTFISQPTLPIVTCDAAEVKRALHHLLVNALEFTPAGGKVTVSTAVDGEYALIRVADTGIGIPAADLPHIFERFYRVDKNRSTLTGGLGLGLAIVKKAITSQQGRVYVESTPESGSCFTIALPLQR
jgi:signal transduction histidine kinase